MNIRQVEVFKAVMETGSVTAAGERLHISQPSVSKHLRLLEAAIDVPLFLRSGNRLTPTVEAEALYDQIDRSYQGVEHIARFAAGLKDHPAGEISVAAMPMLAARWLPELLQPFLARHERVSVALPVRSSRWIADAVTSGRVDIGIGLASGDPVGVRLETLMRTPLVCVAPSGHPLESVEAVGPRELADQTLITLSNFDPWRLAVETSLETISVRPLRRVDTFSTQVACELAARGVGVAIVDALTAIDYAPSGLIWRRFEPANAFEIVLMTSERRPLSRLSESLADAIRRAAARTEAALTRAMSD